MKLLKTKKKQYNMKKRNKTSRKEKKIGWDKKGKKKGTRKKRTCNNENLMLLLCFLTYRIEKMIKEITASIVFCAIRWLFY